MKNKFIPIVAGLLLTVAATSQPTMAADTYGPTAAQETLWSISSRLRPTYTVSTQQVMLAIRAKNPQSFTDPNINALKKGSVLKLPSLAEIGQLNRSQALHTAQQQNNHWSANSQATTSNPVTKVRQPHVTKQQRKTTLANARKTQTRLRHEISGLRTQLKNEQHHSERLADQIKALQASSKNPEASVAELDKFRVEVNDLKAVLEEKNNHIQNLQASLKEASEAIKNQYADNQVLQAKLKSAVPSLTAEPTANATGKPQLTLSGVGNQAPTNTTDGKPPVFTDQLTDKNGRASTQATPGSTGSQNPVPLKSLLEQQQQPPVTERPATASPSQQQAAQAGTAGNTPSRLSLIIALISLLFILALLWRAFSQQRPPKHETANYDPTETPPIHHAANDPISPQKRDGRQEPDIAF